MRSGRNENREWRTAGQLGEILSLFGSDENDAALVPPVSTTDLRARTMLAMQTGEPNPFLPEDWENKESISFPLANTAGVLLDEARYDQVHGDHWVSSTVYPRGKDGGDGSPSIDYFDSLATQRAAIPEEVTETLGLAFPGYQINNLSEQVQRDGYACGDWAAKKCIEASTGIQLTDDIYELREAFDNILAQKAITDREVASMPSVSPVEQAQRRERLEQGYSEIRTDFIENALQSEAERFQPASEVGDETKPRKKVRFDTSGPEVREFKSDTETRQEQTASAQSGTTPETSSQPRPAKNSQQRGLGSNPYLDKDGMDDFDLNALMRSYLVEDKDINYFDSEADSLGIPNPGKPSVMVGPAVGLDKLGDKFEQMTAQRNKAAQDGGLPEGVGEPDKFILPVNVQYEGNAFEKGDHWVLAVMKLEEGMQDGKQNVSTQFIDSGHVNGESRNFENVNRNVGKNFNVVKSEDKSLGDENAQDPNEREPQQSDNNSCGLLVCQNALEIVKDPSGDSLRRYNAEELKELGREKDRRIPLEDFKAGRHRDNPRALRTQLGAVNDTINSYKDLLSDGVPAAEVVNGIFDFLEGDPNRQKGQKNGVIGRLDNFVEDFDVDSPIFTVYSLVANTLGLIIDAAKIAVEKGMAYQGSMKSATVDLEGLEEKRDTLNEKIRQQKMKEIRDRVNDVSEGVEEKKGILSNRAGSDKNSETISKSEDSSEGLKGKAGGKSEEISLGKELRKKSGDMKMEDVEPWNLGSLSPSASKESRGEELKKTEIPDDVKEKADDIKAAIAGSPHRSSVRRDRNAAYNPVSPSRS